MARRKKPTKKPKPRKGREPNRLKFEGVDWKDALGGVLRRGNRPKR